MIKNFNINRRRLTNGERDLLYLQSDGKCEICGKDLPDDFHADHIIPYKITKTTNIHEMQALCPSCNLRKGDTVMSTKNPFIPRKHQEELISLVDDILAGKIDKKLILCNITTGGGKSVLAYIMGKLIKKKKAQRICWITPRLSLLTQGEESFTKKKHRDFFKYELKIRKSTNHKNPSRDVDGYITTYQALGLDSRSTNLQDFKRYDYILVIDEIHHVSDYTYLSNTEEAKWHKALQPLIDEAKYVLIMTGTLERNDYNRIAYIPYKEIGDGLLSPDLEHPEWKVISYSRKDALKEEAIIPLIFHLRDCKVEWMEGNEQIVIDSIAGTSGDNIRKAIYTAVKTEFANELLEDGLYHWINHKENVNPLSKLLIVTANITQANRITNLAKKYISSKNLNCSIDIATSKDTDDALEAIRKFRENKLEILVTVAMAYEGLDVPSITHIIALTHIRSKPWIEQMLGRASRVDYDAIDVDVPYSDQIGYIFAPEDPLMIAIADRIRTEQIGFVREDNIEGEKKDGNGDPMMEIVPLQSAGKSRSILELDSGNVIIHEDTEALRAFMKDNGLIGQNEIKMWKMINNINKKKKIDVLDEYRNISKSLNQKADEEIDNGLTTSEMEDQYKKYIEDYCKKYTAIHKIEDKKYINSLIYNEFRKPRREYTLTELKRCYKLLLETFPLGTLAPDFNKYFDRDEMEKMRKKKKAKQQLKNAKRKKDNITQKSSNVD